MNEQLKDLATKPVSADELARARQPLIESQRKKLETNDYWIEKLTAITREPRVSGEAVSRLDEIGAVTAADIQALAANYVAGHEPLVAISRAATQPTVSPAVVPGTSNLPSHRSKN